MTEDNEFNELVKSCAKDAVLPYELLKLIAATGDIDTLNIFQTFQKKYNKRIYEKIVWSFRQKGIIQNNQKI